MSLYFFNQQQQNHKFALQRNSSSYGVYALHFGTNFSNLYLSTPAKIDEEKTWLWNDEVLEFVQSKKLAKKKWDSERTEESRQENAW